MRVQAEEDVVHVQTFLGHRTERITSGGSRSAHSTAEHHLPIVIYYISSRCHHRVFVTFIMYDSCPVCQSDAVLRVENQTGCSSRHYKTFAIDFWMSCWVWDTCWRRHTPRREKIIVRFGINIHIWLHLTGASVAWTAMPRLRRCR